MWREVLFLIAVIGCVASQTENPNKDDNLNDKEIDNAQANENPVDVPLNDETAAATDAVAKYLGFSCPKGYKCQPVIDCLPCEFGTYKDGEGSGICTPCPPDCTTLRKGAESRLECVPFCPPGYELSHCGNTCTKCRPGTYKAGWEKDVLCRECPDDANPPNDILGLTNKSECYVEEDTPVTTTTVSTTVIADCEAACKAPSETESDLCSASVRSLFVCLDQKYTICYKDPISELYNVYEGFNQDLKNQLVHVLNQADWLQMYSWFMQECPDDDMITDKNVTTTESTLTSIFTSPGTGLAECSSDKECGAGGQCLSGYCGCFTTFCSELAYAALPGCERFCQCDLASGQWKLQTCNLISQELFDETINNCNHMAAIEPNLCASVQCENICQRPPTDLEQIDICSHDIRQYVKCLRNKYRHCGSEPTQESAGISADLYNQLNYLLSSGDDLLNGYDNYIRRCLGGDHTTTLTTEAPPPPTTSSGCVWDSDCGYAGFCDNGVCGCLTTACSELAYAALPGCDSYCQCDVASGRWMLQTCFMLLLFDETINQCNHDYSVDINICASVTCDVNCPVPPSGLSDICSHDVRQFVKCLKNKYEHCGIDPIHESAALSSDLYTQLSALILSVESLITGYYDYMQQCLGQGYTTEIPGVQSTVEEIHLTTFPPQPSSTSAQQSPTAETRNLTTEAVDVSTLSQVACVEDTECGTAGVCHTGHQLCGCMTTNCSGVAYAAMPNCGWFCQCEDSTNQWRLQQCAAATLFDETLNTCNHELLVASDVCATVIHACQETADCPLPSSTDICGIDVRVYIKCLRNKYIQCGDEPSSELLSSSDQLDKDLFKQLLDILLKVDDLEQSYYFYMHQCLADGFYSGQ